MSEACHAHVPNLVSFCITEGFLTIILDQLESVQSREGLRRDGACEHVVLQQRVVCEAPHTNRLVSVY
jgi:hypothetical protein